MSLWLVSNRESGGDLGLHYGDDKEGALEAMAKDAGYDSFAEACDGTGQTPGEMMAELLVEEIPDHKVIEDNAGGLHFVVLKGGDGGDGSECTHYIRWDDPQGALHETLVGLWDGDDPDEWDGLSDDPQGDYARLTSHEHGHQVVVDTHGIYPDRMGRAAEMELAGWEHPAAQG